MADVPQHMHMQIGKKPCSFQKISRGNIQWRKYTTTHAHAHRKETLLIAETFTGEYTMWLKCSAYIRKSVKRDKSIGKINLLQETMAMKMIVFFALLALSCSAAVADSQSQQGDTMNAEFIDLMKVLNQKAKEQGDASNFEAKLQSLNQKAIEQSHTSNFGAKLQSLKDSIAVTMARSCSELCQSANYGDGVIIGTAPICGGNCNSDCPHPHCYIGTTNWSDYGASCWLGGNKVCCCGEAK